MPESAVSRYPWMVHRVATSGHYRDSLHTILTEWTLADVYAANQVIDALADAADRASREK